MQSDLSLFLEHRDSETWMRREERARRGETHNSAADDDDVVQRSGHAIPNQRRLFSQ
jgi:hypothetical protein